MICAAHPATTLTDAARTLIEETAGVPAVCVNPPSHLPFEAMVDFIEAERVRLGVDAWTFWGISGGGWLGQIYARRYPQSLRSVILESIDACFRLRLADPECIISPFHYREQLAAMIDPHSHDEIGDANGEWIPAEGVGLVWRRIDGPALFVSPFPIDDIFRAATAEMWRFDSRAWLHEIRTPALVITGDADTIAPPAHARALHEGITNSQFVVLQGAGHSPVMQRRDDLRDVVRAFLQ